MMNKQDFTKIANRILHPKPKLSGTKPIYPMREWTIGLVIAIIIVGASAAWSAQTFLKYKNTSVDEVSELEGSAVVYRESMVEEALEQFSNRQDKLDVLLKDKVFEVTEVNPPATASSTVEEAIFIENQETSTSSSETEEAVEADQSISIVEEPTEEEETPEAVPVPSN